eukprot:5971285-Prymnesium_polylepis.1
MVLLGTLWFASIGRVSVAPAVAARARLARSHPFMQPTRPLTPPPTPSRAQTATATFHGAS